MVIKNKYLLLWQKQDPLTIFHQKLMKVILNRNKIKTKRMHLLLKTINLLCCLIFMNTIEILLLINEEIIYDMEKINQKRILFNLKLWCKKWKNIICLQGIIWDLLVILLNGKDLLVLTIIRNNQIIHSCLPSMDH